MKRRILFEVCAYSVECALTAQSSGAGRVELCSEPAEGGVTPSYEAIAVARQLLRIPLHVMIRPRGGGFAYSPLELDVMRRDIAASRELGADGVAFGVLTPGGSVDVRRCRELVEAARPMSVTFHRAFDTTSDLRGALEAVIEAGCARILTSGAETAAPAAIPTLADLVREAGERIVVMPGGGIEEDSLPGLLAATGAHEFHSSARRRGHDHVAVDPARVEMMRAIADSVTASRLP